MDKYFCKDCLALWHGGKFMECCPGCVAHRDMGWTIPQMLEVYGPPLETIIRSNMKDPGVYFPALKRGKECTRCVKYNPKRRQCSNAMLWLHHGAEGALPGFVAQQKVFLTRYVEKPTRENWDALDPVTQKKIELNLSVITKAHNS